MPRYIVKINVEGARPLYAVFSTIVMDFVSKFYRSLEDLWRDYPQYKGQEPFDTFNARFVLDEDKKPVLEVKYKFYRTVIKT
jgi:hypothetical protein